MRVVLAGLSGTPHGSAATTVMSARSPAALGLLNAWVKATACEVSSPITPTLIGADDSAPTPPAAVTAAETINPANRLPKIRFTCMANSSLIAWIGDRLLPGD